MDIVLQFTLWMIMMVMIASNSNRIHLICEELDVMSRKLDDIVNKMEKINDRLDKVGR